MAYAIDIECHLVEHLLKIYANNNMPKNYKKRAKECAKELIRKIAIDYRNLCVIMNNSASTTPLFAEHVNGINIMKVAPTDRNFYKIFEYVNRNKDDIVLAAKSNTMLTDAEINAKNLPKDSVNNVFVQTSNFGRRVVPGNKLGKNYKTLFGGLTKGDKAAIHGTATAAGIVAIAVVTLLATKSCQADQKEDPQDKEQYTMNEQDTAINSPSDDFFIPETEAETDEEGNIETEEDTRDYSEPSTERNPDKGASDDFVLPGLEEVEEETEDIDNPAESVENSDDKVPTSGESDEESGEDDGFISGRY